jgi:hypothetical protein
VTERRIAVVIPTRNRSAELRRAIDSVADESIAAVVSDNSTDAQESERVRAACAETELPYVRPPRPLPMTEHWEWALEHALERFDPSHVTFLTDRMMFKSGAIAELLDITRSQPERVVAYGHDAVLDHVRPVGVRVEPWTGRVFEIPSERLLQRFAQAHRDTALPRMLNSVTPRAVLDLLRHRHGSVFASISPDYCFGARVLGAVDSVLFLDRGVLIHHALDRSHGEAYARGEETAEIADFTAGLQGTPRNKDAPVPEFEVSVNSIVSEYCFVRSEQSSSPYPEVDRDQYLAAVAREIPAIVTPERRARMEKLLLEHGWPRARRRLRARRAVRAASDLARHPVSSLRRLNLRLRWSPRHPVLRRLAIRLGPGSFDLYEHTFATPEQAIAFLERDPRPPEPRPVHLYPLLS